MASFEDFMEVIKPGVPDELEGPNTETVPEETEEILVEYYGFDPDAADAAVPDGALESVHRSGEGLVGLGGETVEITSGAYDAVTNPESWLPWWLKYAAGGIIVVAVLAVLSPYAKLTGGLVS